MVDAIDQATGQSIAKDLYQTLYHPLSMVFAHAGPISLARHLDAKNRITSLPMNPWLILATLRTADACVGTLCAAIAEQSGVPDNHFRVYGYEHRRRVFPFLLAVVGRSAPSAVNWTALVRVVRPLSHAIREYRGAAGMPTFEQKQGLKAAFQDFLKALSPYTDQHIVDKFVDALVKH